jgi:hypothetical protein
VLRSPALQVLPSILQTAGVLLFVVDGDSP